jgi:hypothetical protein
MYYPEDKETKEHTDTTEDPHLVLDVTTQDKGIEWNFYE